jgi:two-component system OmpR family sensor kinase
MAIFTKSIRWRLQLWLGFLLLCVLSGFGVTVYQLQRVNQLQQIDEEVKRRVAALSLAVRGGPPPGEPGERPRGENNMRHHEFDDPPGSDPATDPGLRPPPSRRDQRERHRGPRDFRMSAEVSSLFDQTRTNSYYFATWSRDGTLMKNSTNAPAELPVPERQKDTLTHSRMRGDYREAFHFTEMRDCVLAGISINAHLAAMRRFEFLLLAAGGAVLALGLGGGWVLASRAIRPVQSISAAASRISAGNLAERINVAETDSELGRLAGILNSTFARLEAAFSEQKQFTANASHELRTPLAVIISEAQTTLARERNAVEYRETVEACLETAQQMRRLTESLLELARFDAGQEVMCEPDPPIGRSKENPDSLRDCSSRG